MTDTPKLTLEEIKDTAARLVQAGVEVRDRLRALTLQALTQGELAEREIRAVLSAITEGVSLGATQRADEVKSALTDALRGVDDALAHAAEAMQLTLREVASNAREFGAQDLQQGLHDLKQLEATFLEIVARVAEGASGLVRQEMAAIAEHGRRIGTDTGTRVKAVADDLGNRIRASAHEAMDAGKQAARIVGSRVAALASRKLGELAARLGEKAEQLKQK
ncbi:MAG: hypothetical protein N2Z69_06045 [Methylophilaceae bacterium]|nr:hypothetical protein [Methylophilaceae bacterium]